MRAMIYWSLEPPARWKAGLAGAETLYFDCADCGAKDPEIAGILSSDGTYQGIGLLGELHGCNLRPAMFCAPCFAARLAAGQAVDADITKEAINQETAR